MGERKAFLLRIDGDLWAQLERWAQDDLRSVNGQIKYVLRQAVLKRIGLTELPSSTTASTKTTPRKK